jgi:hypothetical protein
MRFAAIVIIIGAVGLPFLWAIEPLLDRPHVSDGMRGPEEHTRLVLMLPGIRDPQTHTATSVSVPDGAEVVGIESDGKHRAYLIKGMANPRYHIVNDLAGTKPISVVYCSLRNCVTAYTDNNSAGKPLDIGVFGLIQHQLALSAKGGAYFQERSAAPDSVDQPDRFPYQPYPFQRTTWGHWKLEHPDTDIFVGDWQEEN